MGSMAKYLRDGDGNRYTPNHKGPVSIDEALQDAENEQRLLQQAVQGNISAEYNAALSEKYPGFLTAVSQSDVIAVNLQKFSYETSSDLANLVTFTMKLSEWTIPQDYILEFDLLLYKNLNTPTKFDTTQADKDLLKRVTLCENFITHFFKTIKVFPNSLKNNQTCANNANFNRAFDRFKMNLVKKSYLKNFRTARLNRELAMTEEKGGDPSFAETKTLVQSVNPNGLIRAINGAPADYQTKNFELYNQVMSENGFHFRVPLSLLCEFFQINTYYGKGKELKIEFYIENDMNQLLELIRPYTAADETALAGVGVAMKNAMIYVNTYRIKQSIPLEKTLYMNSNKDTPYTLLRFAHYEQVVTNIENQTSVTILLGSIKTADVVPHSIILSVLSKKENDHLNKNCFTPSEMATSYIKNINLQNFRRTFVNSPGDNQELDLDKVDDQQFLFRSYVSWCKGNTPSTLNINNFSEYYTADDDTFIKTPQDYFSQTNISDPLVIDTTSDYNYVNDQPPAIVSGNNAFQITIQFRERFTGICTLYFQHPAQMIQTGTGEDENYTYVPNKFKSS